MTIQELGSLGELIGGVAIIVSLIYVGLQIKQNTRATKLSSAQNVSRDVRDALAILVSDAEMASIHLRAMRNIGNLDPFEKHRFFLYMNSFFRAYENAYYQNQSGALDPNVWEGLTSNISIGKDTPGYKAFWRDRKKIFSKEFQEFYERELPEPPFETIGSYRDAEDSHN